MRFIRPFNDWELEEIQRLISLLVAEISVKGRRTKLFG